MKRLKIVLVALLILLGVAFVANFSETYAAETKTLKVQRERPYSDDNGDGTVGNDKYDLARGAKTYFVIKIFDKNTTGYPDAIYCLRGGLGFGGDSVDAGEEVYTYQGDMIKDRATVQQRYSLIASNNPGNTNDKFITDANYNSILWIIDNMYLPRYVNTKDSSKTNAERQEMKEKLLTAAGIPTDSRLVLTDDDIEVIQQVAIWQFSNADQTGDDKVLLGAETELLNALKINIGDSTNTGDIETNGSITGQRGVQINQLYTYLVNNAKNKPAPTAITSPSIALKNKTNVQVQSKTVGVSGEHYLVGPFELEGTGSLDKVELNVSGILKYTSGGTEETIAIGSRPIDAFIADENGARKNKTVKEMVNEGVFYLSVNKEFYSESIEDFTLEIEYDYSYWKIKENGAGLWDAGIGSQPVVIVEKEKVTGSGDDKVTVEVTEFDLALRKFIIKINDKELKTGDKYDRQPEVNTSKLISGEKSTATYTHPKDALLVKTGDKVVYIIRIYNEGSKAGKALEVTDYLPAGLEFIDPSESTINTTYGWSPDVTGKILKTDYLKNTEIAAFNKTTGVPDFVDLQIECKVVAVATNADQTLKNIAEITADSDDDRDSTPNSLERDGLPSFNPSEFVEDDDDYEDLKLLGQTFDLALRKFITKVNDDEITGTSSRVPKLDTKKLEAGTDTTAIYNHPKEPIHIKRGDIVTYTLRIYNEATLDGKALEVTDYLPAGLEFIEDNQTNIDFGWDLDATKRVVTTDYLKDTNIKAFDPSKTSAGGETWQKATDGTSGLYYADLKIVCKVASNVTVGSKLTNIAEIKDDNSASDNVDRDSTPDSLTNNNSKPEDKNPNDNLPTDANLPGYKDTEINRGDNYIPGQQDDDDFEKLVIDPDLVYDLALRKFITKVTDVKTSTNYNRTPNVDVDGLVAPGGHTAEYNHSKDPILVKTGDIVTYTIRVYNEGEKPGKALEVTDYLPAGLEFVDKSDSAINTTYKWEVDSTGKIITTDYLKDTVIPAFNKDTDTEPSYADVQIECRVIAKESDEDKKLRNIAEISEDDGDDRDSTPDSLKDDLNSFNPSEFIEDDDDYEDLILPGQTFDLALRKFITNINGYDYAEVEKMQTGESSREPKLDLRYLRDRTKTTAEYIHSKDPIIVKQGDIVTYTIRVYNEGDRDGYAEEITDYLPEGLGLLVNHKTNFENSWKYSSASEVIDLVGEEGFYETEKDVKNLAVEDFNGTAALKDVKIIPGKTPITTNALKKDDIDSEINLIKGYNRKTKEADVETGKNWQATSEENWEDGLYYEEVQVTCIVLAENTHPDVLENIAEITEDKDKYGDDVEDRDSTPGNVETKNEDDDDYEQLILKYFDLALRKFITKVNEKEVTARIPEVKIDEDGNITYEHPKTPVEVANSDIVTYTIRVYNEGTIAGYAEEVKDNIPEGLEYLPSHNTNKKYEWKMYYKDENGDLVETEDPKKAEEIRTDYLSSAKETATRENEINAFDSSKEISEVDPLNPDYKDVEVAFRVIEPTDKESDRIIINIAEITEDSGDDEDSVPDNDKDGEDDRDKEYIYVKPFDLSLIKWVSKAIVTIDGKTTTTNYTMPSDDPGSEYLVKIPVDKNKINRAEIKVAYKIKIINEGEIEGYATEITDYIPEGLEFHKEDNPLWEKEADRKVTTRALEQTLLKPGESAEVEIVLRWKRSGENLGLKTNIAEISEDYNEKGAKDIDSTPDNKKPEEDDQDFAKIILERVTGGNLLIIPVIIAVLGILGSGLVLIKKYVL